MAFLTKSSNNKNKSSLANHTGTQLNGLPLQAKLRIGQPNDAFEQEADKISDRVANNPTSEPIQRQSEEEKPVQTKPLIHEISRYIQRQATEEEKQPVQTQAMDEEEKPVQTQKMDEEQPVQTQAMDEEEKPVQTQKMEDEEKPVQTQGGMDGVQNDPETEQMLMASKAGGMPLEPDVLQEMENQFGTSFSEVRIHTDQIAIELCRRFNAEAFTHGNHIYFNEGKYDPTSSEGKHLLAHELTHVVQQTGGIEREVIQRANGDGGSNPSQVTDSLPRVTNDYNLTMQPPRIFVDEALLIPAFKSPFLTGNSNLPYFRSKTFSESGRSGANDPQQQRTWNENIARDAIKSKLESKGIRSGQSYFIRVVGQDQRFQRLGDSELLAERLKIPFWDNQGNFTEYQIDHKIELQIAGWPTTRWAGDFSNLILLEREANRGSGDFILRNVRQVIINKINAGKQTDASQDARNLIRVVESEGISTNRVNTRTADQVKNKFDIEYRSVNGGSGTGASTTPKMWKSQGESQGILEGSHIDALFAGRDTKSNRENKRIKIFDLSDRDPASGRRFNTHDSTVSTDRLLGTSSSFRVYYGSYGNYSIEFPWNILGNTRQRQSGDRQIFGRYLFNYQSITFNRDGQSDYAGTITGRALQYRKADDQTRLFSANQDFTWPVKRIPGTNFAGFLDPQDLQNWLNQNNIQFNPLSPIQFTSTQFVGDDASLVGQILPTVPLIRDAGIELVVSQDDVTLQKTFQSSDIQIPSPFNIKGVSLTLGYGLRRGFLINGRADFEIESIGQGFIGAADSTSGDFELEGEFNFDSQLFDPARVGVTYRNNTFGVTGEIGIPRGKVRGIKSARINVAYSEGNFTANGEAELDIRGVERGTLAVSYSEQGWSIGGTFNLSRDIPRIRSGSISVTVAKVAGEEGYRVTAIGTAVPDIPGIDSQLTVEYDNGALKIEGEASYNRGLLSGQVNIGATNRAVGADGQPTGDPGDDFIIYGGGSLTIRITPWLQGTVGVQFLPNGEIQVAGSIGIPGVVEVFRSLEIPDRELIGIGFDIPIFAIPVGPRSIGLKATISGGLRAYAGIGPGRLEQLELGIVYNPAREEETHVTGNGRFVIPADAGLRLVVSATIGLDALIGGVEGGLELGGGLGLEASAEANVNVDWTPTSGLELNASLGAFVEPKFIFTIDGVIRAWFTFYEQEWRWRLADYEYGSNLRFGVQLPIHYREGEPFDISFDNLQLTYPQIDARSFLRGLIRDIRDRKE